MACPMSRGDEARHPHRIILIQSPESKSGARSAIATKSNAMPGRQVVFSFFRYPRRHAPGAFILMGFQRWVAGNRLPAGMVRLRARVMPARALPRRWRR